MSAGPTTLTGIGSPGSLGAVRAATNVEGVPSLGSLGAAAAEALTDARQTVAVFETTTGGLVTAALVSIAGASAVVSCGAVTYNSKNAAVLLGIGLPHCDSTDHASYVEAKAKWTDSVTYRMRAELGADWCLSEGGACGPTFRHSDTTAGFTVLNLKGPHSFERSVLVQSSHADRERNMWSFAKAALDLLAEGVLEHGSAEHGALSEAEASAVSSTAPAAVCIDESLLKCTEDRYGGVEIEVPHAAARLHGPFEFGRALDRAIGAWVSAGKRGLWLKIPIESAGFVAQVPARSPTHGLVFYSRTPRRLFANFPFGLRPVGPSVHRGSASFHAGCRARLRIPPCKAGLRTTDEVAAAHSQPASSVRLHADRSEPPLINLSAGRWLHDTARRRFPALLKPPSRSRKPLKRSSLHGSSEPA